VEIRVGDRWKKDVFVYEVKKVDPNRIMYKRYGGPLGPVVGLVGRVSFLQMIETAEQYPTLE
jgi:hypothetical protein